MTINNFKIDRQITWERGREERMRRCWALLQPVAHQRHPSHLKDHQSISQVKGGPECLHSQPTGDDPPYATTNLSLSGVDAPSREGNKPREEWIDDLLGGVARAHLSSEIVLRDGDLSERWTGGRTRDGRGREGEGERERTGGIQFARWRWEMDDLPLCMYTAYTALVSERQTTTTTTTTEGKRGFEEFFWVLPVWGVGRVPISTACFVLFSLLCEKSGERELVDRTQEEASETCFGVGVIIWDVTMKLEPVIPFCFAT